MNEYIAFLKDNSGYSVDITYRNYSVDLAYEKDSYQYPPFLHIILVAPMLEGSTVRCAKMSTILCPTPKSDSNSVVLELQRLVNEFKSEGN